MQLEIGFIYGKGTVYLKYGYIGDWVTIVIIDNYTRPIKV